MPLFCISHSFRPTLAKEIVDMNTAGNNPHLNFGGFAVGNPFTESYSGTPAMIETYWDHQLLAAPVWNEFKKECADPIIPNATICTPLFYKIYFGVGNINPYALDYPVCLGDDLAKHGRNQRHAFLKNLLGDEQPEV